MDPKAQSWPQTARSGSAQDAASGSRQAVVRLLPGQPGYPAQIGALGAEKAAALWLRGDGQALAVRPAVTVVGSRAASRQGEALAYGLAAELAAQGALVISGGALGIDAAAHRGALSAAGRTCAVLGCGVDVAYPERHARLFDEIAERGCLVSTFAPGSPPVRWHFPARNELMAALAELVVVIEARADSGSLITAAHARRHGRLVAAFAGSAGTDVAIAAGARCVRSVADVRELLRSCADTTAVGQGQGAPAAPQAASYLGAYDDEGAEVKKLLAALAAPPSTQAVSPRTSRPVDLGELCAIAGLSPGDCAAALVDLELRGRCTRLAGGRYIVHAPLS